MYHALTDEPQGDAAGYVIAVDRVEQLSLIPATRDLTGAEIELIALPDRERRLKQLVEPLRDRYDYIVIDCPPSLGLLTLNALVAADSVLIPLHCEYFALEGPRRPRRHHAARARRATTRRSTSKACCSRCTTRAPTSGSRWRATCASSSRRRSYT